MNSDLIEDFLLDFSANWKDKTRQWYYYHIRDFADYLAESNIDLFTMAPRDIARYLAYLRASDISPHTRRSRYQAVRKFFRWLLIVGHTDDDVFNKAECVGLVKMPTIPRHVNRHKPLDVIKLMIDTAKEKESWREAAIFTLLIDTGIRRGELINLDYTDVSFLTNEILLLARAGTSVTCFRVRSR